MYVLIYDGSDSCNDIKRFLESNNIPYRQIIDENFRNAILEHKTLNELKEYLGFYKYYTGYNNVIKERGNIRNIIIDKNNLVIIFHIGWASNHNRNEINVVCKEILVESKESKLKLGVSEGGTKYTEACKDYFDWTGDFGQCLTIMKSALSERKASDLQAKLNCIIEVFKVKKKEKTTEELSNTLLHLFLPLDIDIQALELLLKEKKEAEAGNYFREMLTESKAYHGRICNDVEEFLKQMSDEKKKTEVKTSLNKINNFRGKLIESHPDQISEKFFNDKKNEELKEDIKNFHDWYCALAECLRGEKACKE